MRIARTISEVPIIIESMRTANFKGREGVTRCPAVSVVKRAIKKANIGARYHCGVTAGDLLINASMVTRIAY